MNLHELKEQYDLNYENKNKRLLIIVNRLREKQLKKISDNIKYKLNNLSNKMFSRDITNYIYKFLEFDEKLVYIQLSKCIYIHIKFYNALPITKTIFDYVLTTYSKMHCLYTTLIIFSEIEQDNFNLKSSIFFIQKEQYDFNLKKNHILKQIRENSIFFIPYIITLSKKICNTHKFHIYTTCNLCELERELVKDKKFSSKCNICNKLIVYNCNNYNINGLAYILLNNKCNFISANYEKNKLKICREAYVSIWHNNNILYDSDCTSYIKLKQKYEFKQQIITQTLNKFKQLKNINNKKLLLNINCKSYR